MCSSASERPNDQVLPGSTRPPRHPAVRRTAANAEDQPGAGFRASPRIRAQALLGRGQGPVHIGRRQRGSPARIVVWEHNSHLGDARGTEAALRGELNVGQLVRQAHPDGCCLLGFTTYTGTVTAADDWGGPVMRKAVRPALVDSVEDMFHQVGEEEFLLSSSP
ncbi:erythromycin esterase family protein [Streptomyces sp. NPDC004065]|uniref:erythromycin esterase family protein n=1 Tax=Streptomyces sp. NPDC004065 TaxID=3364689 RepID=UPI003850618D